MKIRKSSRDKKRAIEDSTSLEKDHLDIYPEKGLWLRVTIRLPLTGTEENPPLSTLNKQRECKTSAGWTPAGHLSAGSAPAFHLSYGQDPSAPSPWVS